MVGVAKRAVRDRTKSTELWESVTGLKRGKRSFYLKNQETFEVKRKPVTLGGRNTYRTQDTFLK
jgi:hypothetical protein